MDRRQSGNVTLIFALSGVAAIGMIGGGVEITRVLDARAKLQGALDAGALASAGMADTSADSVRELTANKVVAANLTAARGVVPNSLAVIPDFTLRDRVTLAGEIQLETILGKTIFGGVHTIRASSTAQKATAGTPGTPISPSPPVCNLQPVATDAPAQVLPPPPPPIVTPGTPSPAAKGCFWALGTGNTNGAITFNSGNQINAPTCQAHVHSTDNDSVFHNWGNDITLNALYTKGRVNCNKPCTSNFESYATPKVLNDPYASGLPQLTPGSCMLGTNWTSYDSNSVTLSPGTYCGGINFNSGVKTSHLIPVSTLLGVIGT